jgi:hypothetical protein
MDVRARVIVFKNPIHVCAPCLSTPSGSLSPN